MGFVVFCFLLNPTSCFHLTQSRKERIVSYLDLGFWFLLFFFTKSYILNPESCFHLTQSRKDKNCFAIFILRFTNHELRITLIKIFNFSLFIFHYPLHTPHSALSTSYSFSNVSLIIFLSVSLFTFPESPTVGNSSTISSLSGSLNFAS